MLVRNKVDNQFTFQKTKYGKKDVTFQNSIKFFLQLYWMY